MGKAPTRKEGFMCLPHTVKRGEAAAFEQFNRCLDDEKEWMSN